MALIKCPECKREVSDRAMSCPSCACPLERAMTTGATGKKWKGIQLVSLGAIFLGILVAFSTTMSQGGGLCWIPDRWRADRPPGGHAGLHVSCGRVLGGTLGDNHFLDRLAPIIHELSVFVNNAPAGADSAAPAGFDPAAAAGLKASPERRPANLGRSRNPEGRLFTSM